MMRCMHAPQMMTNTNAMMASPHQCHDDEVTHQQHQHQHNMQPWLEVPLWQPQSNRPSTKYILAYAVEYAMNGEQQHCISN
jgi:hypothetical protein